MKVKLTVELSGYLAHLFRDDRLEDSFKRIHELLSTAGILFARDAEKELIRLLADAFKEGEVVDGQV